MKMIPNNLIIKIKALFSEPEKKEWLDKLVENVENKRLEGIIVPFKLTAIKDKGFVVKVSGLYGFITFDFMPWKYNDVESWFAVSPQLIDKTFFCKIHQIKKDPLSIIINGQFNHFKKPELMVGEKYTGLIIKQTIYGVFVDVGYHFNWKCGSLVGLLHMTQFGFNQSISKWTLGDAIEITHLGLNKKGQLAFSQNAEILDWNSGIPQGLLGQIVWAEVVKKTGQKGIVFLVNGKYKGQISLSKKIYRPEYRTIINDARKTLNDGEIIHCEVTGFDEKNRLLGLKWRIELDREVIMDYSIINILDNKMLQKLTTIREEIESHNE